MDNSTTDECYIDNPGDPDIAGLGVTVAFLTSVCLTAIVVVTLYLRNGLSSRQYTGLDRVILRRLPVASYPFKQDPTVELTHRETKRQVRHQAVNHALFRLLVALSDQQLAVGISLCVALYVKLADPGSFSVYAFRMAAATVWQACFTHMGAMAVLRDDFYRQQGAKWRVVAMAILFALVLPILLLSNFPSFIYEPGMSVKCACKQLLPYGQTHNLNFVLQSVLTVLVMIDGYGRRMTELIRGPRSPHGRGNWFTTMSLNKDEVKIARKRMEEQYLRLIRAVSRRSGGLGENFRFCRMVVREIKQSFLWELTWLAFYYTFGICSLIFTWTILPPLSQWSLSFGQLIPLALLIMCLMPVYDDYKDFMKLNTPQEEFELHDRNHQGTFAPRGSAGPSAGIGGGSSFTGTGSGIGFGGSSGSRSGRDESASRRGDRSGGRVSQMMTQTQELGSDAASSVDFYEEALIVKPKTTKVVTATLLLFMFPALQLMGALFGGVFSYLLLTRSSYQIGLVLLACLWGVLGLSFTETCRSQLGDTYWNRRLQDGGNSGEKKPWRRNKERVGSQQERTQSGSQYMPSYMPSSTSYNTGPSYTYHTQSARDTQYNAPATNTTALQYASY